MIKFETRNVIDVQHWDDVVQSTYNKPYNLQQQDGCMERQQIFIRVPSLCDDFENDTLPYRINGEEMGVSFAAWKETPPSEYRDLFWYRNFYPDVQMLANDLHEKGLIPAGDYHIDIDW